MILESWIMRMSKITIIEDDLEGFEGSACLVMDEEGRCFVVSTITKAHFAHASNAVETFAFPADEEGNVTDWMEVAGGGGMTRNDVIAQIEAGDITYWESPDDEFDGDYFLDAVDFYPADVWDDY